MKKSGIGFLAIWTDTSCENETDYIHWLTREHAAERVTTDGFIGVRVFRALISEVRRYVMLYELETPEVVNSPAYLQKLNNPTPWTKKTLSKPENFWRGGGCIVYRTGLGRGGFTLLAKLDALPKNHKEIADKLIRLDRISSVSFGETDAAATSVETAEKKNRSIPDNSFGALLIVEGVDEDSLKSAVIELNKMAPEIEENSKRGANIYATVFSMEKRQTGNMHPAHMGA